MNNPYQVKNMPIKSLNKPKASVIIPVKNGGELFRRVLTKVIQQETPWTYEILVIDSGSRDHSVEYARSHGARVEEIEPTSFGHGRTRNLGASITSGDFIVFLTQDAMPANRFWLKNLIDAAEISDEIAGAFGRHKAYEDASPLTRRELETHFAGFGNDISIYRIDDPIRYTNDIGYRQFLHFFSNNNSCIRRKIWEKYPFPDVDFAEDQAWAKQIIEAGYSKSYAPEACVYHSHDFGIIETAQRAYDESRALHSIFGYVLVPSIFSGLRSWLLLCQRDITWLKQDVPNIYERLRFMGKAPFLSLAKIIGHYLGGRPTLLPDVLTTFLSRDKRIQRS